ncbi:MAG: hypothetical protein P1U47_13870 [Zhongshania sp.]|uniref:hypothetical protein n=1 Tax=Zhongshania sp. TaxID=1971902 RepID=UPI00260594AE|nr:hypothetical protein [Zhongshania sp.]MDF1693463.1 hypothetical protein [Zhongshania sp.]
MSSAIMSNSGQRLCRVTQSRFKQLSNIAWYCLLLIGLSACASHVEQHRFSADGQPSPVFSGIHRSGIFEEGEVVYDDAAKSSFTGTFDEAGYPQRGEMRQSYQDRSGDWLQIKLNGDFQLDSATRELKFAGRFIISDSQDRTVASAEQSHWLSRYAELHPFQTPPLMHMAGKNHYSQYRRDISPAAEENAFVIVHRPLAGPFQVSLSYQQGLPRGMVKISANNNAGDQYVVERQYFNYQIAPQPVHYFYYELGSFSQLDILGDCKDRPNLTAPQQLLQVYAYDCDKAVFYALSEDFPASVIAISAADLDNGGAFHRFTLYHHGQVSYTNISVDALYDGQWLRHGSRRVMHYGDLKSFTRFELGSPLGIGIKVDSKGARYVRFGNAELETELLPSAELFDKLNGRYEWQVSRLNSHFDGLLVASIFSAETLSKLKADLLRDLNETIGIGKDGQVPGLSELWQSWQRQSRARITTWTLHRNAGADKTAAAMKNALKTDLDKWVMQSRKLLMAEAQRQCELSGQSFDGDAWQCVNRPDKTLIAVCEQYLSSNQCKAMAADFKRQ